MGLPPGCDVISLEQQLHRDFGLPRDGALRAELAARGLGGDPPAPYTVGDLHAFVRGRLDECGRTHGFIQRLWPIYRGVRSAVLDATGVEPRLVRPLARLDAIMPRRGRRARWKNIQSRLGPAVPELVPSPAGGALLVIIGCVVLSATLALLANYVLLPLERAVHGLAPSWRGDVLSCLFIPLVPAAITASAFLVLLPTRLLRREFPPDVQTVGDLVRKLALQGRGPLRKVPWTRQWTWYVLRRALAEHAGERPPQITAARSIDGFVYTVAHTCARCGYDLRASPARCPECGTRA